MTFNPYRSHRPKPFIIAEVGINHNGDTTMAKKIIKMSHKAGCDAVKFQKRSVDTVYTPEYLGTYRESPWGKTQRAQKEGLELSKDEFDEIDEYCYNLGIKWSASSWDEKSQAFLRQYNVSFNKIASPMLTHKNLLEMVAEEGKHTFVSTGMSAYKDIDRAVDIFDRYNCPITLLHCVSKYPADDADCNVGMIQTLKRRYDCPVGYSGHEKGPLPSVIAVSLGAVAVERHVTLDRSMYGSDQSASLERKGLELLVRDTRRVAEILGTGTKELLSEELECAKKLRYFSRDDFDWKQ